jgi:putative membrane protein
MTKVFRKSSLAPLICLTMAVSYGQQLSSDDRQFLENAAKGGMHEVHMGKMGVAHGSSPAVKKYAQRLVDDHKKANDELMALAKRKGVTLPSDSSESGHSAAAPHGQSSAANTDSKSGSKTSTDPGRNASSPGADARDASKHGTGTAKHGSGTAMPAASAPGMETLAGKSGNDFDREFARLAVADHEKDIAEFEKQAKSGSDSEVRAWANKTLPTLRAHLKQAQSLAKQ